MAKLVCLPWPTLSRSLICSDFMSSLDSDICRMKKEGRRGLLTLSLASRCVDG